MKVGTDRGANTGYFRKLRRGISRSQESKERSEGEHSADPDCSTIAVPEMPLQRHGPRLTVKMILQQFWFPKFDIRHIWSIFNHRKALSNKDLARLVSGWRVWYANSV